MGAPTVAEVAGASAESAPAGTGSVLFGLSVLECLAVLLPLLGYPVLINVGLIVETSIRRREPVTEIRRGAATVLAII